MESPEGAAVASYSCNSSTGGNDSLSRGGGGNDCQLVDAVAAATFARRRRRTKRLRYPDPSRPEAPGGAEEEDEEEGLDYSSSAGTATEEEEDMAHCLILLAQGNRRRDVPEEKFVSRRFAEMTTTAGVKAGYYVYECKTCNKCFPSFQALGGHRASHKKPKLADDHDGLDVVVGTTAFPRPPAHALGNKLRVHECSICGLEFASGQALGGHMRRHRPVGPAVQGPTNEEAVKKEKGMLSLDLNLPAPSEENGNSMPVGFGYADTRPVTLVDCHY